MSSETSSKQIIEGEVKRVIPFDSGYAIVKVIANKNEMTLVGDLAMLKEGMNIRAVCTPTNHAKFGLQYKVVEIEENNFGSEDALVSYLSSKSFKGIGVAFAKQIVNHFGMNTLDALDQNPEAVYTVPGISSAKAKALVDCWQSERGTHRALSQLMQMGMTLNMAMKAYKFYSYDAIEIIRKNPYSLTEIVGIGFLKADEIALKHGYGRNSNERILSAIRYSLEQSQMSGHCFLKMDEITKQVEDLLRGDVNALEIHETIMTMIGTVGKDGMQVDNNRLYLSSLLSSERDCAKRLANMLKYPGKKFYESIEDLRRDLNALGITDDFTFAPEQEQALMNCMNHRVSIITGGPGSGKSTITKALCQLFDHKHIRYLLCSPTGKAAKRLTECVGGTVMGTDQASFALREKRTAKTIHRTLEYQPKEKSFYYGLGNPLETNCVIVDETSMLDIFLFRSLLQAMQQDQRLVLIGDANQLPSVGAGNVLRDLIASEIVPTTTLKRIFRQAQGSFITEVAHDILKGTIPALPEPRIAKGKNCMFVSAPEIADVKDIVMHMVMKELPKINIKPDDIQILTPMREKGLGVSDFNPLLQEALNPPAVQKTEYNAGIGRIFRVGDRVMQTRNNRDKGVFNGEQGKIVGIDRISDPAIISVEFPDIEEPIPYDQSELDELMHSWASTVHRSQGSEYPVVIMIAHPSQYMMLQRNLFYTGLTRAKKLCIVVGTERAVERAVSNTRETARNTTLGQMLKEMTR